MIFTTVVFIAAVNALNINSLLNNQTIEGSKYGKVSVSRAFLGSSLAKRELSLPELVITSGDNANTLEALKTMMTENKDLGTGDRLYLESVFMHNGYPDSVNDMESGEFAEYLYSYLDLTYDEILEIAGKTKTLGVKKLLQGAVKDNATLLKRERVKCNTSNLTGNDDCHGVQDLIGGRGCISGSHCSGRCCVSWSQFRCYNDDVINRKITQCRSACISIGRSCKIFHADLYPGNPNFCLGSTAGCKG